MFTFIFILYLLYNFFKNNVSTPTPQTWRNSQTPTSSTLIKDDVEKKNLYYLKGKEIGYEN